MEDVVVQVKSVEHGKEVIQAFKDLGVDTYNFTGSLVSNYYGIFGGNFWTSSTPKNSKVITLDQLRAKVKPKYPCMMEVWNHMGEVKKERKVIADFYTPKGVRRYVAISADGYSTRPFDSARPIQPDPLKEVVEKLKNNSVTLTPNEAQLILDALEEKEK